MNPVIKPSQVRGEATLRRILRATERLLEEKTFDRLSIAEIVDAAGVSVGNFYNRLSDKNGLLLALYENYEIERTDSLMAELAKARWGAYDVAECIDAISEHLVDFFMDRRNLIRSYVLHFRTHPETAPEQTRSRLLALAEGFSQRLAAAAGRHGVPLSSRDAQITYQIITALCRELILFAQDPSKQPLKLDRAAVLGIVSGAARGYVERLRDTPPSRSRSVKTKR